MFAALGLRLYFSPNVQRNRLETTWEKQVFSTCSIGRAREMSLACVDLKEMGKTEPCFSPQKLPTFFLQSRAVSMQKEVGCWVKEREVALVLVARGMPS